MRYLNLIFAVAGFMAFLGVCWFFFDAGRDYERSLWVEKQNESANTDIDIERKQNEIFNTTINSSDFDKLLRDGRFGQPEN